MGPILVMGRHGQLARSLSERGLIHGCVVIHTGRPELNLCDTDAVTDVIRRSGARTVINATGYTAVDQAEDEPEAAWRLNVAAPRSIAQAAGEAGARLIHVSTDYVFNGSGEHPWAEDNSPDPKSVYGRTKLDGEIAVRETLPDGHAIVRTSWVYSPFGSNFVRTMLRLAKSHATVRVVGDQTGNPTCALDLADALLTMTATWEKESGKRVGGLYHFAGTGSASWAEFAREIFAVSARHGGPASRVTPIATSEWPAKAPRPLNSRLDSSLFARTFDYRSPNWQCALEAVITRLIPSQ